MFLGIVHAIIQLSGDGLEATTPVAKFQAKYKKRALNDELFYTGHRKHVKTVDHLTVIKLQKGIRQPPNLFLIDGSADLDF